MKRLLLLSAICMSILASAQKNPTKLAEPIVEEGKKLYRSEMASWYGTDVFIEKYQDRENIGGYFSYVDKDTARCIFFSKASQPKVIGTISFDSSYNVRTANANLSERNFTATEEQYYQVRKAALEEINNDTIIKSYKNTNLNLVPLIDGNERRLYILTGTDQNGVVIFGNDYLLTFDKDNKVKEVKQLHRNIIPINYSGNEEEQKNSAGTMHTHLPETGDFITATDICTLMLYEKLAKWKQHMVVSEKYINVWNCKTDGLTVIPRGQTETQSGNK
jgi:hypothetical protein